MTCTVLFFAGACKDSLLLLGLLPVVRLFRCISSSVSPPPPPPPPLLLLLLLRRLPPFVFVVVTDVCSFHDVPLVAFTPMRFYFGAGSDLSFPLPAASRRVSRVSGFEIKKTHPLDSGKDDNTSRTKRTDDRWRNYRRHPEPRKTSNTVIHPEAR